MKIQKESLVKLNQEIPSLQKDKEGKLRGGFCALTPQEESLDTREQKNVNSGCTCINDHCNDGCTNDHCNDGCTNNQCTTESTVPANGLTVGPVSGSFMF